MRTRWKSIIGKAARWAWEFSARLLGHGNRSGKRKASMGIDPKLLAETVAIAEELDFIARAVDPNGKHDTAVEQVKSCRDTMTLLYMKSVISLQLLKLIMNLPQYQVIIDKARLGIARGVDAGHALHLFRKFAEPGKNARHLIICEHWRV